MALKLYVKLQTPTIELKVSAKDIAGTKDSIQVGFKRYPVTEAQVKIAELQDIWKELSESSDTTPDTKKFDKFLRDQIVYIKGFEGETQDSTDGSVKKLSVTDTRTVKPIETLWDTPEECLVVLLDGFLECAPIRVSLQNALTKALVNTDYSEAETKNY